MEQSLDDTWHELHSRFCEIKKLKNKSFDVVAAFLSVRRSSTGEVLSIPSNVACVSNHKNIKVKYWQPDYLIFAYTPPRSPSGASEICPWLSSTRTCFFCLSGDVMVPPHKRSRTSFLRFSITSARYDLVPVQLVRRVAKVVCCSTPLWWLSRAGL